MPLKTNQEQTPELNLTPMIDIVFLLIIFFMVGTKFTEMERTLDLDVPAVKNMGAFSAVPTRRTVNVYRDGRITLDQLDVSTEQLIDELRRSINVSPKMGVVVRGDSTGAFQNVAKVLSACREAGVTDLGISVQPQVR